MFCSHCRAEIPEGASYCPQCGHAQRPQEWSDAGRAETCEIVYAIERGVLITCRFWARAIGPAGEYSAGESEAWVARYPSPACPEAAAAHSALVHGLLDDGWQHVGRGFFWFNDRFRRDAPP